MIALAVVVIGTNKLIGLKTTQQTQCGNGVGGNVIAQETNTNELSQWKEEACDEADRTCVNITAGTVNCLALFIREQKAVLDEVLCHFVLR